MASIFDRIRGAFRSIFGGPSQPAEETPAPPVEYEVTPAPSPEPFPEDISEIENPPEEEIEIEAPPGSEITIEEEEFPGGPGAGEHENCVTYVPRYSRTVRYFRKAYRSRSGKEIPAKEIETTITIYEHWESGVEVCGRPPTIEDFQDLLREANRSGPSISMIINGKPCNPYPGQDPEDTWLSYSFGKSGLEYAVFDSGLETVEDVINYMIFDLDTIEQCWDEIRTIGVLDR